MLLWKGKGQQKWLTVRDDSIKFPRDGGTSPAPQQFLAMLEGAGLKIGEMSNVLDQGAGICGIAAEVKLKYPHVNVLSYAPHDTHSNQIQGCLERGLAAIIFALARYQVPVPSASYDMVTCKFCWHWLAGSSMGHWFSEVDRVLKPGGKFIISVAAHRWSNKDMWGQSEHWRKMLGWEREGSEFSVFTKPLVATPANSLVPCFPGFRLQPTFKKHLHICKHNASAPPAIIKPEEKHDFFSELPSLAACVNATGPIQNVLNARAGSFFSKAWMAMFPNSWVMNIQNVEAFEFKPKEKSIDWTHGFIEHTVSIGTDYLPALFANGSFGLYHDPCYMLPVYPRTFDVIYLASFEGLGHREEGCGFDLYLEYDRILRPGAYFATVDSKLPAADLGSLGWSKVTCAGVTATTVYQKRAAPPAVTVS